MLLFSKIIWKLLYYILVVLLVQKGLSLKTFFDTSMLDYKVNAAFEEKLSQVELLKITLNS